MVSEDSLFLLDSLPHQVALGSNLAQGYILLLNSCHFTFILNSACSRGTLFLLVEGSRVFFSTATVHPYDQFPQKM